MGGLRLGYLKFQKLTPTQDVDLAGYKEAFEYIFENKDIRNVAISGAYSSGKSSVIESYKKAHKEKKFMHLSLAHFQSLDEISETGASLNNDKDDAQVNEYESAIEGKILNQLIQQIPAKQISQTNFHIKRSICPLKLIAISTFICSFIVLFLHCIKFDTWVPIVMNMGEGRLKDLLICTTLSGSRIADILVMILLLEIALYILVKRQHTGHILHKINVQGNEIEIFAEQNDSYFDKYLNEVLYLFENTGVDVIVFEDIDRFNNSKIFERLREINTLTNIRLDNKKCSCIRKPLRFFYLLRDDIFDNKDRTKFFDFIMPIVPVLDSSNSYNKIKEYMEEAGVFCLFEDHFLRGVSLYIDDLRIVKNICNEFLLYNNKLNKIELDVNKLFAIIVYKNIFPKDFADLQLNKGFVHTLFESKDKLIAGRAASIQNEIASIKERIIYCEKEHLKSEKELNYVKKSLENETSYDWQKRDEYRKWYENEYPKRKTAIEDIKNIGVSQLNEDLRQKRKEIENIANLSFSALLNRENIDDAFRVDYVNEIEQTNHFYEIKSSSYFALLKYLISRGYIDESYSDYMSFFYPNSLSLNDKVFLRSVADRIGKPANYNLDSPRMVTENLNKYDFSQKETLNYELFEYILKAQKNEFVQPMITQIEMNKKFEFIAGYFDRGKENDLLVAAINTYWPEMFSEALDSNKLSVEHIKSFSYITLNNMDVDVLHKVNVDNCLRNYISKDSQYLCVDGIEVEKIEQALSALQVSFDKIEINGINRELFDYVYKHNLYSINEYNIKLMFNEECGVSDVSEILPSIFTFILNHKEHSICEYLWTHANKTLSVYFDMFKGGIQDTSETIVEILNAGKIGDNQKKEYINRLESNIESIDKIIDTKYQKMMISYQKVSYFPENILYYFANYGLDDRLISFINSNKDELDYSNNSKEDTLEKFLDACMISEAIDNEKYSQIMRNICDNMQKFRVKDIKDDKVIILINLGLIEMNLENLEFMRGFYPDVVMHFIKENLTDYISTVTVSGFDFDETNKILECQEISAQEKIALLKCTNKPIRVHNRSFNDELLVYILENNFSETDIPWILKKYSEFSDEVRNSIEQVVCCKIERFLPSNSGTIDDSLLNLIFESENIEFDTKLKILGNEAGKMSKDKLCTLLNQLGADKITNNLCDGTKRVDVSIENETILQVLLNAGVIHKYTRASDGKHYKRIKYSGGKQK